MAERAVLRFHDDSRQCLELDIAGHELSNFRPGHPREVLLSWPLLWIVARDMDGEWSAEASIGSREELMGLAGWLAAIGSGQSAAKVFRFSEPFLSLEWIGTGDRHGTMAIYLNGDLLSDSDPQRLDGERCLRFSLDSERLLASAEELQRLIAEHPEPSWKTPARGTKH